MSLGFQGFGGFRFRLLCSNVAYKFSSGFGVWTLDELRIPGV